MQSPLPFTIGCLRYSIPNLWLDPGFTDVAAASELLKPYANGMRFYPVSARVSNVANDDAECSARIEVAQPQARLF
jgi:putative SOS response-associated peptidase YedK